MVTNAAARLQEPARQAEHLAGGLVIAAIDLPWRSAPSPPLY
jgi:hypothetical protein